MRYSLSKPAPPFCLPTCGAAYLLALFPLALLNSLFLPEPDYSGLLFVFTRLRTALSASKPELSQHPSVFFYAPALSSLAAPNL
ncbi:hypothetical protein J3F84DRAFT_360506 [Trichoderma pleuroticola]